MDSITPSMMMCGTDVLNATKCDGIELTQNLFKDDRKSSPIDDQKVKLETYLRIRPLADIEERNKCFLVVDKNTLLVIPPKGSNASKFGTDSEKKQFIFSKIFDEKSDQFLVYESFALPVVKRFLTGLNGLLFAYGITSSGKSHTMRGTTTNPGVISRALSTVFDVVGHKIYREVPDIKPNTFTECVYLSESDRRLEQEVRDFVFERADKSCSLLLSSFRSQLSVIQENTNNSNVWNDVLHSTFRTDESNIRCSVWISFYEIYNEQIWDLLELDINGEKKQKIMLLKDESDNYYVKGLRQICVSSAEEAYKVLLFGQTNLHISETSLNKSSSRSHCAFTISLVSTYYSGKRPTVALNHLSICDLAGAERSKKANNSGDRIKEAGKINGSLLSLSRCISTIRHNQHHPSKKRLVNFRDSKLTKVFQPYLSGNGIAAMISNMNPSANLFDETLFALNFTGVASQVVVSSEVQRNRFHESLKRLTQVWMQSSQRWSNFAHMKSSKPSVSMIQTINEENEDEGESGDDDCLDVTFEQMKEKVNEITQMDLSRADPQEMEVLKSQIDFLVEKLKQTENDKFEMELEVRRQVVSEFNKLIKDMEDMAENKDKAKKRLEEMMTQRLLTNEDIHKKERLELENKISEFETKNFEIQEEMCRLREDKEKALTRVQQLEQIQRQNEVQIKELESQVLDFSQKTFENKSEEKISKDINTSPLKHLQRDVFCSPMTVKLTDANTSAIQMMSENTVSNIEFCDKGTDNSWVEHMDCQTSTTNLFETSDKITDTLVELRNKSTSIEVNCLNLYQHKETATDGLNISNTLCVDKSMSTVKQEVEDISTSPMILPLIKTEKPADSPKAFSQKEFNDLFNKLKECEKELKEKEAVIEFNRKIVTERDHELKALREEKNILNEKLKSNASLDLDSILKPLKASSATCSIASSLTSKSVKSEDLSSLSSFDSNYEKPKKSSKYSSRKRKPNENSCSENKYLSADLDRTIEDKSSQTSVESGIADEIGTDVYSTKKRANGKATKRRQNPCNEIEHLIKGPESKRKRPVLTNNNYSPISPIPTAERVTRSKVKRLLKY